MGIQPSPTRELQSIPAQPASFWYLNTDPICLLESCRTSINSSGHSGRAYFKDGAEIDNYLQYFNQFPDLETDDAGSTSSSLEQRQHFHCIHRCARLHVVLRLGTSHLWIGGHPDGWYPDGSPAPPWLAPTRHSKFDSLLNLFTQFNSAKNKSYIGSNIELAGRDIKILQRGELFRLIWLDGYVPGNYLYLYGASHCGDMGCIKLWQTYLVLGAFYLQREILNAGHKSKHFVVYCSEGMDRSAALLIFFMCARYIARNRGLGKFQTLSDLWHANHAHLRLLHRTVRPLVLGSKLTNSWMESAQDVLRSMLQLNHRTQWLSRPGRNSLPSIYHLGDIKFVSSLFTGNYYLKFGLLRHSNLEFFMLKP